MRAGPAGCHEIRRRILLGAAAFCGATFCRPSLPASAWCGGYFPGKLASNWDELTVPFEGPDGYTAEIFVRKVDSPRRLERPTLPPVLVVGVPGVPYDYLENLEALVVSGRSVIEVNTCEAPVDRRSRKWLPPPSERGPPSMRRPRVAAEQLLAVCDALELPEVHLFAHGLGGAAALHLVELLREREAIMRPCATAASEVEATSLPLASLQSIQPSTPPVLERLSSLTLASPYGALDDLRPFAQNRIRGSDQVIPLDFEGSDGAMPAEGQQCVTDATLPVDTPYREALLRRSRSESMAASLGGDRLARRLPSPPVATLLIHGGTGDPVSPSWELKERSDVKVLDYPFSGHLPFIDRREEVLTDVLNFLDRVDGSATPRAGLYDGRP